MTSKRLQDPQAFADAHNEKLPDEVKAQVHSAHVNAILQAAAMRAARMSMARQVAIEVELPKKNGS